MVLHFSFSHDSAALHPQWITAQFDCGSVCRECLSLKLLG